MARRRGPVVRDKAKDFKKSLKRLLQEQKKYSVLVIISLILAALGSILTISTPDRLKDLTNEISKGLIVNTKNIETLSKNITINKFKGIEEDIVIDNIKISVKDQNKFLELATIKDKKELVNNLEKAPNSIKKIIEPKMNIGKIKKLFIFIGCIYIFSSLFTYIEQIIMTIVSNKFARELRSRISNKINKLPLKFFDKHQSGDILSRVTNDVDTIAQTLNQSLSNLVSASTLLVGTIIMMFVTNWIMALTAIFSSLFGFIFMGSILSRSQKYFQKRQKSLGDLESHIEESYSGMNVIKVYNAEEEINKKFDKLNNELYDSNRKSQFLSGLMMPMMGFIGNFGYVAVCIVGALLTMNNTISFGVIIAFITYVRLFTSPLNQLAQVATFLQSTAASSERVFEFLDEIEMPDETKLSQKINKKNIKGEIEFKNVEFTYEGNDKPTIKGFNAYCKPGSKIAIVGPTGAGKTTMVNLLMKFYDINKGDILIDGISIKEVTRENIHSLFTMVLQDTWLFEGTIKDNIKFNRKNVSDKKIKEVCSIVGLDHFIKTLPNSYDSYVSDAESISSGQRQLLTIARAMIEDSPFLILDEATSNVDTRTEELVASSMDKLAKGKTSFIIAHRLSTIKNADLILVMKNGNIIETGTHNELLNKKGFYYDLYNSQFEL